MHICTNSAGQPIIKKEGQRDFVLCDEEVTSMDGGFNGGVMDLFAVTSGGSLVYIRYGRGIRKIREIMASRNSTGRIKKVRAICIQGKYHIFYCLDGTERYLAHQVMSDGIFCEPEVIASPGRQFIYDATADENSNIHLVYYSEDGSIDYARYIYSQKKWTASEKVLKCNPAYVSLCIFRDRLFMAYTALSAVSSTVYVATLPEGHTKKAVVSAGRSGRIAFNSSPDSLVLHLAENGMCYEITCDSFLNVSKPAPVGKCLGICRIADSAGMAMCYPVTRESEPFENYSNILHYCRIIDTIPKPKGRDAEEFALKYKEEFDTKFKELYDENIFGSLARIENSLKSLMLKADAIIKSMEKYTKPQEEDIHREQED